MTQIDSRKVLENQILTQCIGIKITFDLLNRKLIRVRQNGEGGRGGAYYERFFLEGGLFFDGFTSYDLFFETL